MISKPETWTDIAFLQIVADMCQVAIHVTGVSDLSEIVPDMLLLLPCDEKAPKALLRVGYWLDRHLVAIVDLVNEKGAAPADLPDGGPSDDAGDVDTQSSTPSEFEIRLASLHDHGCPLPLRPPAGTQPQFAPTPPLPPPPPPGPVHSDEDVPSPIQTDSLLAGLLREMAVTPEPPRQLNAPAELQRARVPRIGFTQPLDHARPLGRPIGVARVQAAVHAAIRAMSRTFTRPDELVAFMRSAEAPPTELIGFEFSGAMLLARRAFGAIAITADIRPAEHDGLHYLGCVQDIIHLRTWDRVYLFPPCFQHLLGDADCLPHKLRDGRAFWAGALVLWCICTASAHAVLVEQPDTLLHHTCWT